MSIIPEPGAYSQVWQCDVRFALFATTVPHYVAMEQMLTYLALSTQPVAIALAQACMPLLRAKAAIAVLS
jgi:hypothetical protein